MIAVVCTIDSPIDFLDPLGRTSYGSLVPFRQFEFVFKIRIIFKVEEMVVQSGMKHNGNILYHNNK